jgi:hypothetical protein
MFQTALAPELSDVLKNESAGRRGGAGWVSEARQEKEISRKESQQNE